MASLVEDTDCVTAVQRDTEADVRVHAVWDDRLREVLFAVGGKVTPAGNGSVKSHVIELKGSKPSKIRFKLQDKTDLDLEFRKADPIWVVEGPNCPTGPGLAGFKVVECKDRMLTVENPGKPGVYGYTLWFIDENGNEYDHDPIIKNIA